MAPSLFLPTPEQFYAIFTTGIRRGERKELLEGRLAETLKYRQIEQESQRQNWDFVQGDGKNAIAFL